MVLVWPEVCVCFDTTNFGFTFLQKLYPDVHIASDFGGVSALWLTNLVNLGIPLNDLDKGFSKAYLGLIWGFSPSITLTFMYWNFQEQ